MQSFSQIRRNFALALLLVVFAVAGVQIAHWDSDWNVGGKLPAMSQGADGLCPICYSVPVGHGATPAVFEPVRLEGQVREIAIAVQCEGIQPEFHLHIRPPPSLA